MRRGIDHLVIAVRDLDAARATYQRLGFTLTPKARHPFGTENSLVQLDGSYLELVAVADPALTPQPTSTTFSFAAFNRDFLAKREGLSMLALKSIDAAADRADFEKRALPVYEPVSFQRSARGPDGVERTVAFTMSFTSDARFHGGAGFFTCQHHFPENLWRQEYQRHDNGARRIASAVLVTRDPADFHEFLTHLTGQHDMLSTSLGIVFDLGNGKVEILSPVGFHGFFGDAALVDPDPRRFLALRVGVGDLQATRGLLQANGVSFEEKAQQIVVPAAAVHGVAIGFVRHRASDRRRPWISRKS